MSAYLRKVARTISLPFRLVARFGEAVMRAAIGTEDWEWWDDT